QRHCDQLAVGRGGVEINRRLALGVEGVRVEDDAGRVGVVGRLERDQERLLFGRLVLHGEQGAAGELQAEEARRGVAHQLLVALAQGRQGRAAVEGGAGVGVLGVDPGLHGWLRRKYVTDGWPTSLMLVNAIGYLAEAAWH